MADILIIYSTTDGHTLKISKFIASILSRSKNQVTIISIDDISDIDLQSFNKIVLGASIRYGKHHKKVYQFIRNEISTLNERTSVFFSVNVVARKRHKNTSKSNPYVKKFLKEITWQPDFVGVFAGKIDYPRYTFWDRQIIRLIMWLTKGPTNPNQVIDFTNWQEVKHFAQIINDM